jgi:ATP-binding cassette subfamily B protein
MVAVISRLAPYLLRYRSRIVLALFALLGAAASTLAMPVAFRNLIDIGFSGQSFDSAVINKTFIWLFALAVLLAFSTALRFYCVSWLGERITTDLRGDVYAQVLRQDPAFFESLKTGEVLSRLSADTTLIQSLVGTSVSLGLRNALLFTGALLMMLITNIKLAAIIVGLLVIVVLPIILFGRRVRVLSRESQDRLADTGSMAAETLNAMQTVQAYGREKYETDRYRDTNNEAFRAAIRRNRSRSLLTALAIILVFGAIVLVLWMGARSVVEGSLSVGLLAQFVMYAVIAGGSAATVVEVYGEFQRAAGATTRLVELLDAEPAIRDVSHTDRSRESMGTQTTAASITFSDVVFSYPSRPQYQSINRISFHIEPGQNVAIVGPSGAGKTTLFQLLLRFYDPQQGTITFNNTPLPALSLQALRTQIGLVSQESTVFSASVGDNIRYGCLTASDEAVTRAAISAQADEFIQQLPEGYDTYVGEKGVRLSGGQRQRLSIARALLKNPPLLLLDEATSALDTESERKVQLALEHAKHGRTTLTIAHRLATIINAGRILVIDKGRLVESGTHHDLVERDGVYAQLARRQFENNV